MPESMSNSKALLSSTQSSGDEAKRDILCEKSFEKPLKHCACAKKQKNNVNSNGGAPTVLQSLLTDRSHVKKTVFSVCLSSSMYSLVYMVSLSFFDVYLVFYYLLCFCLFCENHLCL